MRKFFGNLFPKRYPELDWIQIEITTHCNGRCVYCPQFIYSDKWQSRYLPLHVFHRLGPAFEKTSYIHLQGWGEPLLHPDFFEMLAFAKARGCAVGTTTNGSLLTSESIERLIGEQLNIIAFSLAGVDNRNDAVRRGTSIEQVLQAVEQIHSARAKYNSDLPKIHIAYMLLRSGLRDIARLPAFFANIGAGQVVVSTLSIIARPELIEESFVALAKEEYQDVRRRLLEVREESVRLGVDVHYHIASPFAAGAACSENIQKALVIGSDGNVSPCVMTDIPVRGEKYFYISKKKKRIAHISFGNITTESLSEIWHRQVYKAFRGSFAEGCHKKACRDCLKLCIDDLTGDVD
jgi:MoaA/NifB/PqqE/SkfB family radical SAM enzyme